MVTFAALGHVNKCLGIVTELAARGHLVSYPVSERFAAQVQAAGAVPVIYRSTLNPEPRAAEWPALTTMADEMFRTAAISMLPQIEAAYRDDRPDLFLYKTGCWVAPALAARWHKPTVQVTSTRIPLGSARTGPATLPTRFRRLRRDRGVGPAIPDFGRRPEPCLALIPRSFQTEPDRVPGNYTFVGPCLADRPCPGAWQRPDDRPVLLITLGSVFTDRPDLYRRCLEAFGGWDWTVVMAVGSHVQPSDLGSVPANFEIHRRAPQLAVLAQARAFISHCGMGGTMEALYHGVPIVGVPQAADQFENAARLTELGLGVRLPRAAVTADRLRAAVRRVTSDPAMAVRLAAMRREIRALHGARTAADLIERQLAARGDDDAG